MRYTNDGFSFALHRSYLSWMKNDQQEAATECWICVRINVIPLKRVKLYSRRWKSCCTEMQSLSNHSIVALLLRWWSAQYRCIISMPCMWYMHVYVLLQSISASDHFTFIHSASMSTWSWSGVAVRLWSLFRERQRYATQYTESIDFL